jgi:hypothetical protein
MKTLKILLVLVSVILSGFSKDSQRTEAGVVKSLKFWGGTIPDLSSGRLGCSGGASIVRLGWMQGHQTHGGALIPEQSPWEITSCIYTGTEIISQCRGTITVANGDSYFYTGIMTIYTTTGVVHADGIVDDGEGKFEGVTGKFTLNGSLGSGSVVTWSGEGSLSFPK